MAQELIIRTLKRLGFEEVDIRVYVFLAKAGSHSVSETARTLQIRKSRVLLSIQRLTRLGVVSDDHSQIMSFSVLPFDEVLDKFASSKIAQARSIQLNKDQLLLHWKMMMEQ